MHCVTIESLELKEMDVKKCINCFEIKPVKEVSNEKTKVTAR